MARAVDALREGVGPDDPWLALLLGCVSLSRALADAASAPDAERRAPPAAATPAPDAALLGLLGIVALGERLRARLELLEAPRGADASRRATDAAAQRGLLR